MDYVSWQFRIYLYSCPMKLSQKIPGKMLSTDFVGQEEMTENLACLWQISAGRTHSAAWTSPPPPQRIPGSPLPLQLGTPMSVPPQFAALQVCPLDLLKSRLAVLHHFSDLIYSSWRLLNLLPGKVRMQIHIVRESLCTSTCLCEVCEVMVVHMLENVMIWRLRHFQSQAFLRVTFLWKQWSLFAVLSLPTLCRVRYPFLTAGESFSAMHRNQTDYPLVWNIHPDEYIL